MLAKKMFDIYTCKCAIFKEYICPKESKFPAKEQVFLTDQRTERNFFIGSVDVQKLFHGFYFL